MDEDGKILEQRLSGVDFQFFPIYYHTWSCPVFVLESPLQGGPSGIPKWEPSARTGVYLGKSLFHAGSLDLVLNTRTGNFPPQYHVVFENTLSTVDNMKKGTVPVNCKNLVEEHSKLAT